MMDEKWVYEGEAVRLDRANKRLFALCVILIASLILSNAGWVYYESQFKTISIEAEQEADADGSNYVIGGNYGGEAEGQGD